MKKSAVYFLEDSSYVNLEKRINEWMDRNFDIFNFVNVSLTSPRDRMYLAAVLYEYKSV